MVEKNEEKLLKLSLDIIKKFPDFEWTVAFMLLSDELGKNVLKKLNPPAAEILLFLNGEHRLADHSLIEKTDKNTPPSR